MKKEKRSHVTLGNSINSSNSNNKELVLSEEK